MLAPATNKCIFAYETSDTSSTLTSLDFAHFSLITALLSNWNTLFYIASIVTCITLFQFSKQSFTLSIRSTANVHRHAQHIFVSKSIIDMKCS